MQIPMEAIEGEERVEIEGLDKENCEEDECKICRICRAFSLQRGQLISPCNCKGSVGFVHTQCLQQWLQTSLRTNCEICMFRFRTHLYRRYSIAQGVRIWLQSDRRRHQFKADVCNMCLLTIILTLIVLITLLRLENAAVQGEKNGISKGWTQVIFGMFLTVVSTAYSLAICYLIRKQIAPFYKWWWSTHQIQLELRDNSTLHESTNRTQCSGERAEMSLAAAPIQIVLQ